MKSDRCHNCGHRREEHHYQPGNGCCVMMDRFGPLCDCKKFEHDPDNDPRQRNRRASDR